MFGHFIFGALRFSHRNLGACCRVQNDAEHLVLKIIAHLMNSMLTKYLILLVGLHLNSIKMYLRAPTVVLYSQKLRCRSCVGDSLVFSVAYCQISIFYTCKLSLGVFYSVAKLSNHLTNFFKKGIYSVLYIHSNVMWHELSLTWETRIHEPRDKKLV